MWKQFFLFIVNEVKQKKNRMKLIFIENKISRHDHWPWPHYEIIFILELAGK